MDRGDCWSVLGIAATGDLATIRRAYATSLKAIDVERDPQAFIVLRSAYEAARDGVAPAHLPDWDEDCAGSQAWRRPEMDAIVALLYGEQGREAIFAPLAEQVTRLIAYAHGSDIARSAEIETWIADTIVDTIPRSNAMLDPAIQGFGWDERAWEHDCPYAIAAAVERQEDVAFVQNLFDMAPHYRRAWVTLTGGESAFGTGDEAFMATLLGVIQHRRPALFQDVDLDAFQRWVALLDAKRMAERALSQPVRLPPPKPRRMPKPQKPAKPRNPRIEAVRTVLYLVLGATLDLLALGRWVVGEIGFPAFAGSGLLGALLIGIGLERRAARKRDDANRLSE